MNFIPPATILVYHRVEDEPEDPYALCVTPKHFASHLEALAASARFADMDEMWSWAPPRPRVMVTFDDGYADNLHVALPIAERFEVPLTVFITSGALNDGRGFWWDRLAGLVLDRPEPEARFCVETTSTRLDVSFQGLDRWERAMWAVQTRLRSSSASEIEEVLAQLEATLGPGASGAPAVLTDAEVIELSQHPLVTIGAHTTDHALLAGRSAASQTESILRCKEHLESLTGERVNHFAYPFGGRGDFDETSVDAVDRAGFETACTAMDGRASGFCGRFLLPRRFMLDWDTGEFSSRLATWGLH